MKRVVEMDASTRPVDMPGQIDAPPGLGPPDPMWKLTGIPNSCARDQSGSQYGSLSAGSPHSFLRAEVDVPEGHERLRVEPSRPLLLKCSHAVVVTGDAEVPQLEVRDLHDAGTGEPEDVRVEDLGAEPELVHVRQPGLRIGGAGRHLREALEREGAVDLASVLLDHAEAGGAQHQVPVDDPPVLAFVGFDHARSARLEASRRVVQPEVRRLGEVRVDVDDRDLGKGGVHRFSPELGSVPEHPAVKRLVGGL